jgi:hypothetical protein
MVTGGHSCNNSLMSQHDPLGISRSATCVHDGAQVFWRGLGGKRGLLDALLYDLIECVHIHLGCFDGLKGTYVKQSVEQFKNESFECGVDFLGGEIRETHLEILPRSVLVLECPSR